MSLAEFTVAFGIGMLIGVGLGLWALASGSTHYSGFSTPNLAIVKAAVTAAHHTLHRASQALAVPTDQDLLYVGWYFDPAFAATTTVTPANRPALDKLAEERKADVDDLISEAEGAWPVDYTYAAALPPGVYAETRTDFGPPFLDSGNIKIGPFFFAGTFPGKTMAENQTETILHEWTHAYWQTYDTNGWWSTITGGTQVYITGMTALGQPIYPAPGITNRTMHADTWGWFIANWYTP